MKTIFLSLVFFFFAGMNCIHAQKNIFLTGTTHTRDAENITVCRLNNSNGKLKILAGLKVDKGPGYICLSKDKALLYAVSEEDFGTGSGEKSVGVYRLDREEWKAEKITSRSSKGMHPCHLSLSPEGDMLFAANYSSGSIAAFPVLPGGEIDPACTVFRHEGSGPDKSRQEGPHAHYIHASPDGKYVYSADLGTDKIMIYKRETGRKLIPNPGNEYLSLAPGSGPRHMDFHPSGEWVFILNELANTVVSCRYNQVDGSLEIIDEKSSLEPGFTAYSKAAAIRVHPGGKYLYCSNRGENSLAVFKISGEGKLEKIQSFKEGIGVVRDFNILPGAKYLVAGNQDRNEVISLKISRDGLLHSTNGKIEIAEPTCIAY